MALRMERSVANAAAMADFLKSHPLVKKMNYAGLSTHPGADIHARQATSGGAVLSFETGGSVKQGVCPGVLVSSAATIAPSSHMTRALL
jgi:cystathionine beta-lyase/cystathionine gamma-synthase